MKSMKAGGGIGYLTIQGPPEELLSFVAASSHGVNSALLVILDF
jgi:hypothetical protein